jgi:hypothetical protein
MLSLSTISLIEFSNIISLMGRGAHKGGWRRGHIQARERALMEAEGHGEELGNNYKRKI